MYDCINVFLGSYCPSFLALPLMYFLCVSGVSIFLQGLSLRRRRHRVSLVVLLLLSRVPNDIPGVSSSPFLTFISTRMGRVAGVYAFACWS